MDPCTSISIEKGSKNNVTPFLGGAFWSLPNALKRLNENKNTCSISRTQCACNQLSIISQSIKQSLKQPIINQTTNQSINQSIKRSIYRSSIHLALPLFVFRYFFLLSLFVSCVVCVFSGGLGFPGVVVHSEFFLVRSCSFVSFRSSSYINYSINQSINHQTINQ